MQLIFQKNKEVKGSQEDGLRDVQEVEGRVTELEICLKYQRRRVSV